MRTLIFLLVLFFLPSASSGQVTIYNPNVPSPPRRLDPYNPTDAAILRASNYALIFAPWWRDYLDPYRPTDAAILRTLTGAVNGIPFYFLASPGFMTPNTGLGYETGYRNLLLVTPKLVEVVQRPVAQLPVYIVPRCYAGNRPPTEDIVKKCQTNR
jgi:hypothetical protein